jgi:hypothetical protein
MIVNAITGIDTILDEELLCDYIYDEDNYYVRSDLGIDDKDLEHEYSTINLVI